MTLVACVPPNLPSGFLGGIDVLASPSSAACYRNSYRPAGDRSPVLLSLGNVISRVGLDQSRLDEADMVLLAPAYLELATPPPPTVRSVWGVPLQGAPLRTIDRDGLVSPVCRPLKAAEPFVNPAAFLFFTEEDVGSPSRLALRINSLGGIAIITRSHLGSTIFRTSTRRDLDAYPAQEVEPPGAGDCFAAAFLLRLAETGDLDEAACYGLAVGSLAVESPEILGIHTRKRIEARIRGAAA